MKFRGINSKPRLQPAKPFQGEVMTCKICGRTLKSDKHQNSDWTAVSVEGQRGFTYFCPVCFGNADLKNKIDLH